MRRAFVLILALGLAAARPGTVLAARDWTVTAAPDDLTAGVSTAIQLTVTNTSQTGPGIACVQIEVPAGFTISGVAVVSIYGKTSGPSFLSWTTVGPSGWVVAFKNALGNARLDEGDQAVFRITGTTSTPGSTSWTTDAADSPGLPLTTSCGVGAYPSLAVPFDVDPVAAPTPKPTKTPKPTAAPAPRPGSTPAATKKRPSPTTDPGPTLEPGATAFSGAPSVVPGSEPTVSPEASFDPATTGDPGAGPGFQVDAGRDGTARSEAGGLDGVVLAALNDLPGGLLFLAFPAFLLGVPGLLLAVAVGAQAVGSFAWLPFVRRRLGPVGLERLRLEPRTAHVQDSEG